MKPLLDFNLESTAIRSLQVVEDPPHVSLPLLATASDVRETVQFLKRKPEGITSAQAMDSFRPLTNMTMVSATLGRRPAGSHADLTS